MTADKKCVRYVDEFVKLRHVEYCCHMMEYLSNTERSYGTDCATGELTAMISCEVFHDCGRYEACEVCVTFNYCPHCGAEIEIVDVNSEDFETELEE